MDSYRTGVRVGDQATVEAAGLSVGRSEQERVGGSHREAEATRKPKTRKAESRFPSLIP